SPRVDPARAEDEPVLRALLRESPMPSLVDLTFEREPDFFGADVALGDPVDTLVARAPDGTAAGVGQRALRTVALAGTPEAVAYLGGLRLRPEQRASGAHAEAWRQMRRLHEASPTRLSLSSITDGNTRARRLLTLGRPPVPRFEPLAEVATLAFVAHRFVPQPTAVHVRPARDAPEARAALSPPEPLDLFPLADPFRLPGLRPEHVWIAETSGETMGAMAVWDPSPVRQTVVRGYRGALRWGRPLANGALVALGAPRLPSLRQPLASGMAAHAWARTPEAFADLVRAALRHARQRRLAFLLVALDRTDCRLATPRRGLHLDYASTLYTVRWDADAPRLRRPLHVELPQL
ncbi:MAG: hypothetical protein AAFQ43_07475, partial [Bacteroidota bacterium]